MTGLVRPPERKRRTYFDIRGKTAGFAPDGEAYPAEIPVLLYGGAQTPFNRAAEETRAAKLPAHKHTRKQARFCGCLSAGPGALIFYRKESAA